MLVLSRKHGEEIYLDVPPSSRTQKITVTVSEIQQGKVRIGITADRDVQVIRSELVADGRQWKRATA